MNTKTTDIVKDFWRLMNTNDFRAAGSLLHDDYIQEWENYPAPENRKHLVEPLY